MRVERPKSRDHGDWATNIALQLGKKAGMAPRDFAQILARRLAEVPGVGAVDIAGPGFLNITLDAAAAGELARTIVEAGKAYGTNETMAGHVVNLEFVSANPTGPLHIGHTRWAALGDAIARVLRASGADVTSEYYINDAGNQMNVFARSVYNRMHGLPVPEGGYPGEYIKELADIVEAEAPQLKGLDEETALPQIRELAYVAQMADIKKTLADFGVSFDVFFSETSLHEGERRADLLRRRRRLLPVQEGPRLRREDLPARRRPPRLYAHARSAAAARNAAEKNVTRESFDASELTDPTENELLAVLGQFPSVVAGAAESREPHRIARYLEQVAGAYHSWYAATRITPIGEDTNVLPVHSARLWLNDATTTVLANGLELLGVSAPERM